RERSAGRYGRAAAAALVHGAPAAPHATTASLPVHHKLPVPSVAMQSVVPLACFLSLIRPPAVQYENAILQLAPVDKAKCPYVHAGTDVSFQLYTRHNPTVPQRLALGDDELLFASSMDWAAPTVLYFHAFMEQPDDGSAVLVREAYMQRGDCNVIMVDAARLEAGPWYPAAALNTWFVGQYAARMLDYLAARGLRLNATHLVGHSLGAHAAGVAGAALRAGRVARITGLDPALPLFAGLPAAQRLDPGDADFVDVIHTDAGIFGYKHPLGHADFFPNGGASPQPGCELEVVLPQQLLLNKCAPPHRRRKRFLPALRRERAPAPAPPAWPALAVLGALLRGAPLVSVARVVSTRVTSRAGELAHVARETARYIGRDAPPPPAASLQVGGGWLGGGARLSVSR
ncbi:hypothetical protein HW555_009393, partial [Spodoptera exigua]